MRSANPLKFPHPKSTPPPPLHKTHGGGGGRCGDDYYCNNHRQTPPHQSPTMFGPARRIMLAFGRRRSRWVFLLLCSPILLPFLCATFPLLCAAELCIRLCRIRWNKKEAGLLDDYEEEQRMRRCEEGLCDCNRVGGAGAHTEVGLLQRYLEDQLLLVGSVYECGDDIDDSHNRGDDIDDSHNRGEDHETPLLG